MITKLKIDHYKSLHSIELFPKKVNIFVGPNGSGKSNIIDVLRFLKNAIQYDLDRAVSERHGIDSIREWSRGRPYNVNICIDISTESGYGSYSLSLGSSENHYVILREEATWTDEFTYVIGDEFDPEEPSFLQPSSEADDEDVTSIRRTQSFVRFRDGKVLLSTTAGNFVRERSMKIENADELFLPTTRSGMMSFWYNFTNISRSISDFEAYVIFPNTLREPQTPSNDLRLLSDGRNLTSVIKSMTKSRRGSRLKEDIVTGMNLIMPSLENIIIQSIGGFLVPVFRVTESDGRSHNFNVSQISDGSLRVLGLLTALYQPSRPSAIALEEPEQTVNPGVLGLLADSIQSQPDNSQLFVTTHSPDLLDKFDAQDVFAVDLHEGITRCDRVSDAQLDIVRNKLFSLGELMSIEGIS